MHLCKVIRDLENKALRLLHALLLSSYKCTLLTWDRTRLLVGIEEQRAGCKESHLPGANVGLVVPSSMLRLPPSIPNTVNPQYGQGQAA